jgi:hypothetical protein
MRFMVVEISRSGYLNPRAAFFRADPTLIRVPANRNETVSAFVKPIDETDCVSRAFFRLGIEKSLAIVYAILNGMMCLLVRERGGSVRT